eukprot:Hpha_TRINITY_DN15118_c0_g3::TRINITY_DN15118_c0_g3_i5::g.127451::m.127451
MSRKRIRGLRKRWGNFNHGHEGNLRTHPGLLGGQTLTPTTSRRTLVSLPTCSSRSVRRSCIDQSFRCSSARRRRCIACVRSRTERLGGRPTLERVDVGGFCLGGRCGGLSPLPPEPPRLGIESRLGGRCGGLLELLERLDRIVGVVAC